MSNYPVTQPYDVSYDARIMQIRQQVEESKEIMHQNIDKAIQRDYNLNALENNIENLQTSAGDFRTTAVRTKRWFVCKNRKWTVILIIVIVIIILLLALAIGLGVGLTKSTTGTG